MIDREDMTLQPPEPFRFREALGYLSRSADECLFRVDGDTVYKWIGIAESGERALVSITEDAPGGSLRIRFLDESPYLNPDAVRRSVARYVSDWLDLDTDLAPFYEMAAQDPILKDTIRQFYGLRLIGIPDLFEALIWAVLGQQITLSFAYTLKRRFVETFGSSTDWNGHKLWAFPEPATVAALKVEQLTSLQLTGKKAEYIIGIAQRMTEGSLSKQTLLAYGDFEAAAKEMVSVRGIGPWTAHYVLMRCLRDRSAFPIADVGLHNAIKVALGLGSKPDLEQIREWAKPWGEWKAYATFYLWRTLY